MAWSNFYSTHAYCLFRIVVIIRTIKVEVVVRIKQAVLVPAVDPTNAQMTHITLQEVRSKHTICSL